MENKYLRTAIKELVDECKNTDLLYLIRSMLEFRRWLKMTTYEIYQFINQLEPESEEQAKIIKKLLLTIDKATRGKINDRTQLFIDTLECDTIFNKEVGEVYKEYCDWCKKCYFTPIERSAFSKRVCESLNMKSKVTKVNGKSKRVYH